MSQIAFDQANAPGQGLKMAHRPKASKPLYQVQKVPGKGMGLIARADIPKGTRIITEVPLMTLEPLHGDLLERQVFLQLQLMSKSQQREFLALHNNWSGEWPFGGIVKTNALPCPHYSDAIGVFSTISRINHSCLSNTHHQWDEVQKHETVHALRDIKAGEELTLLYTDEGAYADRQQFLRERYHFYCHCELCSRPDKDRKLSDDRRLVLSTMDCELGVESTIECHPQSVLASCRVHIDLTKQEFPGSESPLLARTYYDAFQVACAHGDVARASEFAARSYKQRVICEGPDSPAAMAIKRVLHEPSSYPNLERCSSRWQTEIKDKPRDLDAARFEKWLWERAEE